MRYTRNRQLIKATGQTGWKEARVLTIEYMRKATVDIDPTFMWHRDKVILKGVNFGANWVQFRGIGEDRYIKSK